MGYTSEADKGAFLAFLEDGYKLRKAAKKASINKSTAFDIKTKAGEVQLDHIERGLPPPTRQEMLAIWPKTGRPPTLIEEDKDQIFAACTKDRDSRRTLQHLIAEEEGFIAYRRTIENAIRER